MCEDNSSCRDEIKLIAIKKEDKISKCTGVSVDNAHGEIQSGGKSIEILFYNPKLGQFELGEISFYTRKAEVQKILESASIAMELLQISSNG